MTSFLKNYLVVLHAIIFAVISTNWFFNGSAYRSLQAAYTEYKSEYIEDVQVGLDNNKVSLTVKIRYPQTCQKVISDLGVNNILVGIDTYKPTCVIVKPNLIRIVYTKVTEL